MINGITSKYYKTHVCCPSCNNQKFSQTYIWYPIWNETSMDENECKCSCGWIGIVHDLVPKAVDDVL